MPRATELDKTIGKKILELRLAMGLSRENIANDIGVTHQQIAKYESGTNRLSIGRLLEISEALETDPSYFYSDLISGGYKSASNNHRIRMNLELARNLQNIDSKEVQDGFLQLTKNIANQFKKGDKKNGD